MIAIISTRQASLTAMNLKSLLHRHPLPDILLHPLISLHQARQQPHDVRHFISRNHNHAISSIAEDQISRRDERPVNVQWDLDSVRLGLCSRADDGC